MNGDIDSMDDLCQLRIQRRALILVPLPHIICQFKDNTCTHNNAATTCHVSTFFANIADYLTVRELEDRTYV